MDTVFLNGSYLPKARAVVSVDDRGFLFGDGVYEVTIAYHGQLFRFDRHLCRLQAGLDALRIDFEADGLEDAHRRLLEENGLTNEEAAIVYLQVTRGVAPRSHAFPKEPASPTVYAYAKVFRRPANERWERGYRAITVPDRRWARVDIKSIALLPNVLSQQAAVDAGVDDAIYVRDGVALEGAHNNIFAVFGNVLTTHPASHQILHGITREYVLELARGLGIPVKERQVPLEEIRGADEIFFTGTTTEVRPTVELDGNPVGTGKVGPIARTLYRAYQEGVGLG